MENSEKKTLQLISDMLSPELAEAMMNSGQSTEFAAHLGRLAFDNIFAGLWARPGLDRRSRSLVTLGMLIALRATEELQYHIPAALKNGVTLREIEEVIYHATGYAGFPAAASARKVALNLLTPSTPTR